MKFLFGFLAGIGVLAFLGFLIFILFLRGGMSSLFYNDFGNALSIFLILLLLGYFIQGFILKRSQQDDPSPQVRNNQMIKILKVYAVLSLVGYLIMIFPNVYLYSFIFILNFSFWVLSIMIFRMGLTSNIALNIALVITFYEMALSFIANFYFLGMLNENIISNETFFLIDSYVFNIVLEYAHFPLVLLIFFNFFKKHHLSSFLLKLLAAIITINLIALILSFTNESLNTFLIVLALELMLILGFVYKTIRTIKNP